MTQTLTIVRQENIQTIISDAPVYFNENRVSYTNCLAYGEQLLKKINEGGMTEGLDKLSASYINSSRATIKKMNDKRSAITKLFDDIRKEFTTLENGIDPTKSGTIPYQIQQLRNSYAAKKREEEERRCREEAERLASERARKQLRLDMEDEFKKEFRGLLNMQANWFAAADESLTLENYNEVYAEVQNRPVEMSEDWISNMYSNLRRPAEISVTEFKSIECQLKEELRNVFREQYNFECTNNRDDLLMRMPSKKANLERIAKESDVVKAECLKAELAERERKMAEEKEAECMAREEEERQKEEVSRKQSEINDLFASASAQVSYQPKAKVSKKIELLKPEGILSVIMLWWSKEGVNLSVEELAKTFKKQITYCEKLANSADEVLISDACVRYIEEVKAR